MEDFFLVAEANYFIENHYQIEQLSPPSLTPALLRIFSNKHHLVTLDCKRFNPTNNVKKKKYSFTKYPKLTDSKTKVPAINFIVSLIVICV